jgi:hypothetical protein
MLRQRKKADPTDITLMLVIVFFIVISFVVAIFVNSKLSDIISNTVLNESAAYESINDSFTTINRYTIQRGFTLFFGILIIGILVSSFMIKVHPIFIFIYIVTLIVAIFVSMYLANAYEMVVSNGQLALLADNYATMTWVMQHIGLILLAVGALSMIIIFGKIGGGGNNSTSDL